MLVADLDDYLTEYRLQPPTEPIAHYDGNELFRYVHIGFLVVLQRSVIERAWH